MTATRMPIRRNMRRQAGVSILELMIAITIGLFLLAGLVSVFATSNQAYVELGRASQQIENGRLAMQILTDDVGEAGFYGRFSNTVALPVASAPIAPCESGATPANLLNDAALPLYGYDAPASVPAALSTCLASTDFVPGTDILIVRRADSTRADQTQAGVTDFATLPTAPADGSLKAGYLYMQASADPTTTPVIAVATGAGGNANPASGEGLTFPRRNMDGTTFAPIRRYHVHIYFVAPCSIGSGAGGACAAGDDSIPTLKRLELTSNGVMSIVPLVEGIENFQVDYGIDADGQGVPDGAYITAPATPTDWSNVVAVRINVLARNVEASAGYSDTKSYDMGAMGTLSAPGMGGTVATLPVNYKRHVYNAVVRVVNVASRRES